MKVCAVPVPFADTDYRNYDPDRERKREDEHMAAVKNWLVEHGYTGKHTGEIYRTHVADGYACYMFADAGRSAVLIHLPYGDAYDSRDVKFLPKKEVLKRIEADKRMTELFRSKGG